MPNSFSRLARPSRVVAVVAMLMSLAAAPACGQGKKVDVPADTGYVVPGTDFLLPTVLAGTPRVDVTEYGGDQGFSGAYRVPGEPLLFSVYIYPGSGDPDREAASAAEAIRQTYRDVRAVDAPKTVSVRRGSRTITFRQLAFTYANPRQNAEGNVVSRALIAKVAGQIVKLRVTTLPDDPTADFRRLDAILDSLPLPEDRPDQPRGNAPQPAPGGGGGKLGK
jgi:hypothetical protein